MGHTIYLADDEKSIRELLHSFLASDGYTVRSFESGDALLEAFRQEPAELVILDIMMPGTDGLTVCRELRAVSDIPIILLTFGMYPTMHWLIHLAHCTPAAFAESCVYKSRYPKYS